MVFTVDPDSLHGASVSITGAANSVAAIDVAADLRLLATALPGSGVSSCLPDIAAQWGARIEALRVAVGGHGRNLGAAAGSYAGSEGSVRAALVGLVASTPRPRS